MAIAADRTWLCGLRGTGAARPASHRRRTRVPAIASASPTNASAQLLLSATFSMAVTSRSVSALSAKPGPIQISGHFRFIDANPDPEPLALVEEASAVEEARSLADHEAWQCRLSTYLETPEGPARQEDLFAPRAVTCRGPSETRAARRRRLPRDRNRGPEARLSTAARARRLCNGAPSPDSRTEAIVRAASVAARLSAFGRSAGSHQSGLCGCEATESGPELALRSYDASQLRLLRRDSR